MCVSGGKSGLAERVVPIYLKHVAQEKGSYELADLKRLYEEISDLVDPRNVAQREYCKILCFLIIGQATHGEKLRDALQEEGTALDSARAMVAFCEFSPDF